MNLVKYFFVIFIILLNTKSFSYQNNLNKEKFLNFYCNNLKIYNDVLKRYGFIPNSWELDTATLIKKDIMVQPRMIQFSLNYLRIKKYLNIDQQYTCSNLTLETDILSSIKKFTNDYRDLFPWKKKQMNFVDKENEPMNIYDIGDWLTILSVTSTYYNQKDLTNYALRSSKYLINLVNNTYDKHNKWPDSFNYKLEPNFDLEIGHVTLFIDGLLHVYKDLKINDALIWLKNFIIYFSKQSKNFKRRPYDKENDYSTSMTYGEFLETTHLFLTSQMIQISSFGIILSDEMIKNFKRKIIISQHIR